MELKLAYKTPGKVLGEEYNNAGRAYPRTIRLENQVSILNGGLFTPPVGTRFVGVDWGINPLATCSVMEVVTQATATSFVMLKTICTKKWETLPINAHIKRSYLDLLRDMRLLRTLVYRTKVYAKNVATDTPAKNNAKLEEINDLLGQLRISVKTPEYLAATETYQKEKATEIKRRYGMMVNERRKVTHDVCLIKTWYEVNKKYISTRNSVYKSGSLNEKIGFANYKDTFKAIRIRMQNMLDIFNAELASEILRFADSNNAKFIVTEELTNSRSSDNSKYKNEQEARLALATFKRYLTGSEDPDHFINLKYGIGILEVDENNTSRTIFDTKELGHRNFTEDKTKLYDSNGKAYDADIEASKNIVQRSVDQHSDLSTMWGKQVGEYVVLSPTINKNSATGGIEKTNGKRVEGAMTKQFGGVKDVLFKVVKTPAGIKLKQITNPQNVNEVVKLARASKQKQERFYRIRPNEWVNETEYKNYTTKIAKKIKNDMIV